nr:hypothetical protein GCM10025732_18790 [Glycomyces mayteni]
MPVAEGAVPDAVDVVGHPAAGELELPAQVGQQVLVGAVVGDEPRGAVDVGLGLREAALDDVDDRLVHVGPAVPALGLAGLGEGAELGELGEERRVALLQEHDPPQGGGEEAHLLVAGAAGDLGELLDDLLAAGGGAGAPGGGVGGPQAEGDLVVVAAFAGGDHEAVQELPGEGLVLQGGVGGLPARPS